MAIIRDLILYTFSFTSSSIPRVSEAAQTRRRSKQRRKHLDTTATCRLANPPQPLAQQRRSPRCSEEALQNPPTASACKPDQFLHGSVSACEAANRGGTHVEGSSKGVFNRATARALFGNVNFLHPLNGNQSGTSSPTSKYKPVTARTLGF